MCDIKVYAVVVTYNRMELLKKNIECLRENRPYSIVVVNNGSTDGTAEWLERQKDLTVITQENVGGAGGFCTGMKYAYDNGADWVWCMDDDVFPRKDSLSTLLKYTGYDRIGIMAPRRLMDGKVFTNDFLGFDLYRTFGSMYRKKLSKMNVVRPIEIAGTAFEGMFVKRDVITEIGYPNKELFIFCDDTDFCLRAGLVGYKILYVPEALMDKHRFFADDTWAERQRKKKWKRYYQIRNSTYLNHHYGKTWGVRYIRGFNGVIGYILTVLFTSPFSKGYSFSDIPKLWKAYHDGIKERLGR